MMASKSGDSRVGKLLGKTSAESEVADEFGFHLEMRTRELISKGMDPAQARAVALQRFGDIKRVERECKRIAQGRNRRMQWKSWFGELRQDFLFALRQSKDNLSMTALVVLTLALGIGANAAVFSIVNAVILSPLPVREADRLVRFYELTPSGDRFSTSEPNFADFEQRNRSLSELAAMAWPSPQLTLLGDGAPENLSGVRVSASAFRILGLDPIVGRTFSDQEVQPATPGRVIVLSQSLWQNRFASDPEIAGKTLNLDGENWTVIGVVPEERTFLSGTQAWIPFGPDPASERGDHRLEAFGRLKEGISLEQARQDLQAIAAQLSEDFPDSNRDWSVELLSFQDWLVGPRATRATLVLQCSVALMLLLASANVSNLLIARATARQREIALRSALGAGRFRIIRQLVTESVFLSALGAAAGLLLAYWCIPLIASLSPDALPRIDEVSLDFSVLAFLLAVSLAVGILSGIAPAIQASRSNLSDVLKTGRHSSSFSTRRSRDVLVAAELGLALMLLIGAGLLVRSFWEVSAVDPGFQADNVWGLSLALPQNKYAEVSPQTRLFYRRLLDRIEEIPGVDSVGASMVNPLRGPRPTNRVAADGTQQLDEFAMVQWRSVSQGYFKTLSIPLLQGRVFDETDRVDGEPVRGNEVPVVISARLARRLWGDEPPLGKRIRWGRPDGMLALVIGVVGDVRDTELESDPPPTFYFNLETVAWPSMTLFVRSSSSLPVLRPALQEAIWAEDSELPIPQVWPLEQNLSAAMSAWRLNTRLMGAFAFIALVIACMGIYGIMSYSVTRRRREIGVRMAMGARPANMVRLILKHGLALLAAGTAAGVAGALALTHFLQSMLYETSPTHLATFLGLALGLGLVGTLASLVPALKAARVDPSTPLRSD